VVNTGEQAIAKARTQHRHGLFGTGTCLMQVRKCYGIGSNFPSAAKAWAGANHKHRSGPNGIPRGVPVFWVGGSHGFGHIAISLGDGLCETTDFVNRGGFGVAHIDDITRSWGLTFEGWTEDLNGVRVWEKPVAPEPRKPPTPAPVDPKKVPQATHYEEFVLGVRKLWANHGQHIQAKYKARRDAAKASVDAANSGPRIRKGVKK
jgi:hypothetical protein